MSLAWSLTAHCLAALMARHWDARSDEMTDGCSACTMAEERVPMKRTASTAVDSPLEGHQCKYSSINIVTPRS